MQSNSSNSETQKVNERTKILNTNQVKETVANLKSADLAAYKAGTKSNFLVDYVRNEVITNA